MNEVQARAALRGVLAPFLLDPGTGDEHALDDATSTLLALFRAEEDLARPAGSVGALLPARFVIPNEDLELVDTVFAVLTAAAGAGYFLPHLGFDPKKGLSAVVTSIAVAVIKLLRNLRLSVRLSPEDLAIVALLARAGPRGLDLDTILCGATLRFPELSADDVRARLKGLEACARLNGEKASLVWLDAEGYWHANGI